MYDGLLTLLLVLVEFFDIGPDPFHLGLVCSVSPRVPD